MADIIGTSGNDTLDGTGGADIITALSGNDTVNAGAGDDVIRGGTGNDTLNGEDGDDIFIEDEFTTSLDIFNGGAGFDTLELRAAPSPILTLLGALTPHTLNASNSLSSIERLLFASQVGEYVQASLSYANFAATGITQIVGGAGLDLITLTMGTPVSGTYTMLNLPISGFDPISLNAWEHTGDRVVLSAGGASAATSVTLNALAGVSFMQLLAGGAGNDILNGTVNADMFDATRGGDQVNAGDGNDMIIIANTAAPSSAPTNFTGAGGVWDGGSGTDVVSIGGVVNLQATLLNIEGFHLQPSFFPPVPNTTSQTAAELILDSARLAMLSSTTFFSGSGTVRFDIADGQSFSNPGFTVTSGSDISFIVDAGDGDGLSFTGDAGDDIINLGRGSQTAYGGDGDDILNNGVSFLPGAGLISMYGENGDDLFILDNPTENNILLNGGAGEDLLQLYAYSSTSPSSTSIVHAADSSKGGGISGIENLQFMSLAGAQMVLVANVDAGFVNIFGGAGRDLISFRINNGGTYSTPSFTLNNWNPDDTVLLAANPDLAQSVTLNGRNDIRQTLVGALRADTLNGGSLSDRLIGGGGADTLNGNDGDDFLHVETNSAGTFYNGGAGLDTLYVNGTAGSLGGVTSIEAVFFATSSTLTLTGTQFANGLAADTAFSGTGTVTINMTAALNLSLSAMAFASTVRTAVNGTSGDDAMNFGATLNTSDIVNGGSGNDQVAIAGNYTGGSALVLGATTLTNVEVLAALPGGSYDITLNDANTAAGATLTVFGGNLGAGESFRVNGSAETNGNIITYGGLGTDTITGGAGSDGFYFGPSKYGVSDTVSGGAGTNDQLALDGNYTLTITSREDVEVLALLRGPTGTPNTFNITVADSWTPTGQTRIIWGAQLVTNLVIDASAETNGSFIFFGGTQSDTLTGGAGGDAISGGGGGDALLGGLGNDLFRYSDLSDSNGTTNATRDRILDFVSGDKIDLSGIDAVTGGGNDAFSFIGGGAFTNVAGQLRSVDNGNGTYTIEGDVNGDGIADLAILVTAPAPIGAGDFVL